MSTAETAIIRIENGQIVAGTEFQLVLATIRERAEGLVVHDTQTSTEAKQLVQKTKDEVKAITAAAEPRRLYLKRQLDEFVAKRDLMIAQFTDITDPLAKAAREYDIAEVNNAQAEQADLNHGQRAENRVSVKPNVEAVTGTRFVPKYRAEILDASKIKREWMSPDIPRMEAEARKDKNPAVTQKKIGAGVRIKRI